MSRNSFGYTMVEVMLVLLILGIVSSVAVPTIKSSLDEMKIDGAAREVVSALSYAQSLAIQEGVTHGVKFNKPLEKFHCYKISPGAGIINPLEKKPYVIDFTVDRHFQGVEIVSAAFVPGNKDWIEFNALGESSGTGSVVIGYSGSQRTINVTGLLGALSVN